MNATSEIDASVRPLVSVLINNHNYGRFVAAAIESALAQTYDNVEVIVVDDGSTDCSREVIGRYGNRVVSVLKENGGQASAFNAGFAASRGDIFCFLDADDLFLPEKASTIVQIFQDRPRIGWCFDQVQQFNNNTGHHYARTEPCEFGYWDCRAPMVHKGKGRYVPTTTSGLSFRRSALSRILPMPEIPIPTDAYLKLTAVGLERGWMASHQLTLQRIHGDNVYTLQSEGKEQMKGLTGLLVGMSLYERFPTLRRAAIRAFSSGLGTCWMVGSAKFDYMQLCKLFLRNISLKTKAEILLRASYNSALVVTKAAWRS